MTVPHMESRSSEAACTAVVQAVAAAEGIDPREITEPLSRAIDTDGLDAICHTDSVHVSFEYHGYLVTIDGENTVTLTDAYPD